MKLIYIADMRLPTEKAHGVQIMKMCEAFARQGAAVELVVPRRHNRLMRDPFIYYGVEHVFTITKLPTLDLVGLIPRVGLWIESTIFTFFLVFHLWSKKVDAIYSRNNIPLYFLSFFKDNLWWEPHVGSWNFVTRRVLKKIDGLISITEGGKDYFVSKGISGEDVLVAHDGVDLEDFDVEVTKSKSREHLGLPQKSYIAMYIGLFDEWKGYKVLLEASEELKEKGVEVVMMGGTAKQVEHLKNEYPHVHFTGYRPYTELPQNQKGADVLVLPNSAKSEVSTRFTSPLKLFAYMASGRPIVASNIPTLREVLKDGENALLVEPDSPHALAQGIIHLVKDPNYAASLASRAYKDVTSYTWLERAKNIMKFMAAK